MNSVVTKLLCLLAMLALAAVPYAQQPAAPATAAAPTTKPAAKAKAAGKKAVGKAKPAGKAAAAGKAKTTTAVKAKSAPKKAAPKTAAKKAPSHTEAAAKCPAFGATPRPGGWMQRHASFLATAKKGNVDVLFIGDSITDGWNKQVELWNKNYVPLKAANFGIGGDRTENIIWRITNGELDGIQPKVIVMLIGTNNTSKGDSAEDITRGITTIVRTMQARLPETKIMLLGVYPRGDLAKPETKPYRENIAKVNEYIKALDDGAKVRYIYFGDKFLAPDGSIPKSLMPDALHLSTEGYQIWVDSINPLLKEMMQ